jgi:hypothetical protein
MKKKLKLISILQLFLLRGYDYLCYIGLKWLSLYYIKIEIMKLTLLEMYELYRNGLLTKKILNDYEK